MREGERKKKMMMVGVLLLAGCGADVDGACQNYDDAWVGCIDEAYADDPAMGDSVKAATEGTCDVYDGAKDKESADLLNCYADTISGGDCSPAEAYATTVAAITDCG